MALFRYTGRNHLGQQVSGRLDAVNESAVAGMLAERQVIATSIVEDSGNSGDKKPLFQFNRIHISIDEKVMLCRQLYSLLKAGVPTTQAIHGLGHSNQNPDLKQSLLQVEQALEAGNPLAASLQQQPEVYDDLFVSMVHVGENTGRLDTAFSRLAGYLELERTTRQRLKQATRYPLTVVIAISVAMVIINIFVVPQFARLFQKFNTELPLPTRILIGTSNLFVHWWPLMLAVLVGGGVLFYRYIHTTEGRYRWDGIVLRIPILGPLFEKIVLGRFARTFAMTYSAGLPILQSLTVVARAVANKFVERAVMNMRGGIERGDSFTRTAQASGMFSPLVMQMISVGETTGSLDDLLDEVGDFYEQEVDYGVKRLGDAIEPILLVLMGIMVLMLALGVFLPMWDMYGLFVKKG